MARIQRVQKFELNGKLFNSESSAIEYAESIIADTIKKDILSAGFTLSQWVKISSIIIDNRHLLLECLAFDCDDSGE